MHARICGGKPEGNLERHFSEWQCLSQACSSPSTLGWPTVLGLQPATPPQLLLLHVDADG